MITIEQNMELNILKAQMEVLKHRLADNRIVSDEMLRATVKASVRSVTADRRWNIFGIAVDFLIAAFMAWMGIKGKCSMEFALACVAWGMFWAVINWQQYRADTRRLLLDDSLMDMVEKIAQWRRMHTRQGVASALATAIWTCFLLKEIWGDISSNARAAVFVAVIFALVIGKAALTYCHVYKTTGRLLRQIKETRGEE